MKHAENVVQSVWALSVRGQDGDEGAQIRIVDESLQGIRCTNKFISRVNRAHALSIQRASAAEARIVVTVTSASYHLPSACGPFPRPRIEPRQPCRDIEPRGPKAAQRLRLSLHLQGTLWQASQPSLSGMWQR